MHVDETGGYHMSSDVDVFGTRRRLDHSDTRDAVALDQDVPAAGGGSRPVHYRCPAQHDGSGMRHNVPPLLEYARKVRGFSRTRRCRVSSSTPAACREGRKRAMTYV